MKFSFKIQQYQTDAVNAVVDVFKGQVRPAQDTSYFFDPDRLVPVKTKKAKNSNGYNLFQQELDEQEAKQDIILGYANAPIKLDKVQLLENIKLIQGNNNITPSKELIEGQGKCSLDIEMETGTGKTYVYIKTMFELNRQYGWNKFIIIVPSVAIREGVKKSLETMEEHFMSQYGRKARYFIYDSKNLTKIDDFAKSNEINVMIINNKAFAKSLNEEKNKEGRGGDKGALIIYSERDEFGSRKPIDVIAKTNPILILDEPQKLNGPATQKAMKRFNPLFSVNYSATHKQEHNEVYRLDAIDAYNHKLVKKIEVKGIEVVNLKGIDGYLYCDSFVKSKNKPPMVKLEFEQQLKSGTVKRVLRNCASGDNLYELSNGMLQYEGYKISDIDASDTGCVRFTNGEVIHTGEVIGDVSEADLRRVQIRETIKSHFEKEEQLFAQGIKTLSLFFIDEVAKYRLYDEDGTQKLGEYGKIFEEEYQKIFRDRMQELYQTPYGEYLRNMAADVSAVHTGYFSIDKKGHSVDSKCEHGKDTSNDESAYDLIMRNKEALLSFNNPVRFIFSHSALREGWDNPNVFQICTLKQSNSNVNKRQEVGRGMRICVNQQGERMDESVCGANVHVVNKLTVIASESYAGFVDSLQDEIKKALYERPEKVSIEYFFGRVVKVGDETYKIEGEQARQIVKYLDRHDYLDDDDRITEKYKQDAANGTLEPVQDKLKDIEPAVHVLIKSLYDKDSLKDMITNGNQTTVENKLNNKNFEKQEFQELWKRINRKCAYTVKIESNVLIDKAVAAIDAKLQVTQTLYTLSVGYQKNNMQAHELEQKTSFVSPAHTTNVLENAHDSSLKYDLLHELTQRTSLTRRTVATILSRINMMKYMKFRDNPEEFISKVARLINEQKAGLIVEGVTYNTTNEVFDKEIFTAECHRVALSKVFPALRAVTDYVVTDGIAEQSVERRFVENLDKADEVAVYAKLPRGFYIPTPVGKYSPDWAIAFKEGKIKYVYFIAETKGTNESTKLDSMEQAKIKCAEKLFEKLSNGEVHYGQVKDYKSLMDIVLDR